MVLQNAADKSITETGLSVQADVVYNHLVVVLLLGKVVLRLVKGSTLVVLDDVKSPSLV